jgi:glutathione synthase/RimK-type ligase-like ATP-grasp enzyme
LKILVISSSADIAIDLVAEQIGKSNEIITLDPKRLTTEEELQFEVTDGKYFISTKKNILTDVETVWFRKPILLQLTEMETPLAYQGLAHSSYKQFVTWLYSALDKSRWISPYWNIQRAESKPLQISTALHLGFNVPATVITNSALKAKAFLHKYPHSVIKTLNIEYITVGQKAAVAFTRRASELKSINFEGLKLSPAIFQKEIVGLDSRVTVIGHNCFAVIIRKAGSAAMRSDWRWGNFDDSINIEVDKLFPEQLKQLCLTMVHSLGLSYGAFDFVRDKHGYYWFLEMNPNGEWVFVEQKSGLNLSSSFATLLLNKST